MSDLFAPLDPSPSELERLRDTLAARADLTGDGLDVAYRVVDSPVGLLLVAGTDAGTVRVAFPVEDHEAVLDDLARRLGPRVLRSPHRLDAVARELDEYFAGTRTRFDVPLDRRLSHGFRGEVQAALAATIPYGRTASYGEVAGALARPRAVRAVGSACATNPLPILQPCHRVLRSDGSLGGYLGGLPAKELLLGLEASVTGRAG